ncbi:MAG: hypothetical protein IJ416_04590 [Ruminiclostridium sp.]|nr:hypothetical protein [Ruminiclostridium sp.]
MRIDGGKTLRIRNAEKKTRFKISGNIEKLSSGYSINRAADNAAGLAVSEKMRALIRGLSQANNNTNDGMSLVNVGEGALQEVHDMLQRIREMAVQSSNGTYCDEVDREGLQLELESICGEVDRVAKSTNFNGIPLFQDEGYESEYKLSGYWERFDNLFNDVYDNKEYISESIPLETVLANKTPGNTNIIYTETTFAFDTNQVPGTANSFDTTQQNLAETLKSQIVPNVVTGILNKYPAFDYLNGSNIGIGLNLYSDSSTKTLAYVQAGAGIDAQGSLKTYQLSVNTAFVNLDTNEGRSELERTIAHEMIHAFMDESMATGMFGTAADGSSVDSFPMWFIEGMAQTASGPGNWVNSGSGLGIKPYSTAENIQTALNKSDALLSGSSSSTKAQYGTGYLAAMYLGYKAAVSDGSTVDFSVSTTAAAKISNGISDILYDIISGESLSDTIAKYTDYNSLSEFEAGFANDADVISFVEQIADYTTNGIGGLISGDLSNSDPVSNADMSSVTLFELNSDSESVKNYYPSDVNIFSGGAATVDGTPPVSSIAPPEDVQPITYPTDLFTVTGGTEGTDWSFDESTGVLTVLSGKPITISGGTASADGTDYFGRIEIADNIGAADITLDNVNIDQSSRTGSNAGLYIGDGNNVTITLANDNEINGGGSGAGIQMPGGSGSTGSALTINGTGNLTVNGGSISSSSGGAAIGNAYGKGNTANSITINDGNITANGGFAAAAIGAAYSSDFGDITINGGNISAVAKSHGAGIGGGWVPSNIGNITITGGTIYASGIEHGTGIGGGCQGSVKDITISGDDTVVVAKGGNDGAGIGASWNGKVGTITIDGGKVTATGGRNGAGIGSGLNANGGDIIINGGEIIAEGATDAAGIGSGRGGTNTGVYINGGTVSAKGGLTHGGGNIGGYLSADYGVEPPTAPLVIAPGLTIKAGDSGEGLYNTTGATTADGTPVYALPIDSSMLPDTFVFPVSAKTLTGESFSWDDLKHMDEDAIYIWMTGEDHVIEVTDSQGNTTTLDMVFYPDAGVWRLDGEEAPPPAEKPTYSDNTLPPVYPGMPEPEIIKPEVQGGNGIILQIGAYSENIFVVPQFYFSANAMKMELLDISTRPNANATISRVDNMIKRVSVIRNTYGAIHNSLEHTVNSLTESAENTTASESRIRDTDMAKEMMKFTANNILTQSGQAMIAHSKESLSFVLQMLQQ